MYSELKVYLKDSFVGWLSHESVGDEFSFGYAKEYLANPKEGAISFALPLSETPFDTKHTYNFFANLLPPRVVRQRLGASLHLSQNNVFGFLKAIGGDCAGAVSLYPPWIAPGKQDVERCRELTCQEAIEILKSLRRRPLYAAGEEGYRYSSAGAQDKLIARVEDGKIILPLFGTPSTHIIKPPSADFECSVQNEYFCHKLALALNLDVAKPEMLKLGEELYYVSARYDREMVDGKPIRLHQEDFCQLLSFDPEVKYEEDGGPTLPMCMNIARKMRLPVKSQLAVIDSVLFNFLIGNADAHAKNISVVYRDGKATFAPLYDLVCTKIYKELSSNMAMRIGEEANFKEIGRASFEKMAKDCGVSPKLIFSHLHLMASRLKESAKLVAEECDKVCPSPVYDEIMAVIFDHIKQIG